MITNDPRNFNLQMVINFAIATETPFFKLLKLINPTIVR